MPSHYQKTTAVLREQYGLRVYIDYQKVEFITPRTGRKYDLFHIIDLLILKPSFIGIQVCGSDYMPHVRKIRDERKEYTIAWLSSGAGLEIWSWRKKKKKWVAHIADVTLVRGEIYIEERWKK